MARADDREAIRAWNLLADGSGGIDWAGLPLVCELLGVTELEPFLMRLEVIKNHHPKEQ